MSDQNNLPEAEDTKTRVTAKVTPDTPGKKVPQIDLNAAPVPEAKKPANTMTGRTMKLQGLAGMAPKKPAVSPAPAAEPAPAAAPAAASDDTRTKRTVKLASLAAQPTVKNLDLNKPQAAAPAVSTSAAANTVTRRTQKLEALDTQDVVAMTEVAPSAVPDTQTRKAAKISAMAAQPAPQTVKPNSPAKHTVKVEGIMPASTAAPSVVPATVQIAGVAPATQSPVKPVDDVPKTIQVPGVAPATKSPVMPADNGPSTIQVAAPAEDTRTQAAAKVAPAEAPEKFKAGNVDDTVKLQRPAPKPVMPGSVAPATQSGGSAVGGIKLNKPKPVPKPAPKPAAEPAPAEAEKAEEKEAEAPKTAEPTGNLGKDQTPPKKRKGLKVNTDAIKDLGSSPAAAAGGAVPPPNMAVPGGAVPGKQVKESLGINIAFSFFGVLALLLLVFVALVATFDYLNIWQNKSTERIDLPIISEHVYSKINQK